MISDATPSGWTQEKRQAHSAKVRALWTEDKRSQQSDIMVQRWADPEWRELVERRKAKAPNCPDCGETDLQKFYLDKKGRRTNARCRECHKVRNTARWQSKTLMEKRTYRALKYGLTPPEFLALYEKQNGLCAICGTEPTTARGLHIDHCHTTGAVRGLLCHGCNVGIGSLKEDVVVMRKAIAYLEGS